MNLINGYTGQFSLGHAGFMAVGAYTSAAITMFVGPHVIGAHPSTALAMAWFVLALYLGGLVAAIAGILVGAPSLRLKGDYLAIVTLGFGEIIRVVFRNIESLGGALGLNGIPPYTNIFWVFGTAVICTYVVLSLVHSTYGRGFIAVHDDEVAAEAMGINTTRYKIVAFVIGAFFAGLAGGLYAHSHAFDRPQGFRFHALDRDCRDGHSWRDGKHNRCHSCGDHPDDSAGNAPQIRIVPNDSLFVPADCVHADASARVVHLATQNQTGLSPRERILAQSRTLHDPVRRIDRCF